MRIGNINGHEKMDSNYTCMKYGMTTFENVEYNIFIFMQYCLRFFSL